MVSNEGNAHSDPARVDDHDASPSADLLAPGSCRRLRLYSAGEQDRLVIHAPDGSAEMTIRLTQDGPVVELRSACLELTATRDVTVRCERFGVEAAGEIELSSGKKMRLESHALELEARAGNIDLHSNDDVTVSGERIFLNR